MKKHSLLRLYFPSFVVLFLVFNGSLFAFEYFDNPIRYWNEQKETVTKKKQDKSNHRDLSQGEDKKFNWKTLS